MGRLEEQIAGVEKILNLEPRARVLDLFCGRGLPAVELARRGYRVLGLGAEQGGFDAGRRLGHEGRLNVHFVKGDPRQIPYRSEFDAALALSFSFGRFLGERDDAKTLEGARKGLKPGGKLLLDLMNKERLMRDFESLAPGQDSFNLETGRFAGASGNLRVYALTEIKRLLAQAGLVYLRAWGGFDGSDYALDSPRMVVLAEKPREVLPAAKKTDEEYPATVRIRGRRKGAR
jgi:SAM-dependent methyltransferase